MFVFFFFQAEDGIRDVAVTGVQTCALPILLQRVVKGDGCTSRGRVGQLAVRLEGVADSHPVKDLSAGIGVRSVDAVIDVPEYVKVPDGRCDVRAETGGGLRVALAHN